MRLVRIALSAACLAALAAFASVVGSVRGVIHDPQHRPVQNAMVMLKAKSSDWSTTANSDANGNFAFNAVPLGEYVVSVAGLGFEQTQQDVMVISGTQPVLHFALNVAGAKEIDQRLRHPRIRAHRFLHADHGGRSSRDRPHSRRGPLQQPGDDHRLCARRLHHARPASHSRRTSNQLAGRRRPGARTPTSLPTSDRSSIPKTSTISK